MERGGAPRGRAGGRVGGLELQHVLLDFFPKKFGGTEVPAKVLTSRARNSKLEPIFKLKTRVLASKPFEPPILYLILLYH